MGRLFTTVRFLASLLVPGGVLLLASWAVQSEDVVWPYAAPYAAFFGFGALVAAVLLSWYYDQCRLLCCASAVLLTIVPLATPATHPGTMQLAGVLLLPLNFSLFGVLKERGVVSLDGLIKVGIVAGQAAGVYWIAGSERRAGRTLLGWSDAFAAGASLPWIVQLTFALAAVTLLVLVFSRRTKVEQGLAWALAAMFLGFNALETGAAGVTSDGLLFYAGTAGLVLIFAALEHGYDIAFRDELTGLPGRRAFNNMTQQLGGVYAIAMCDVDHFKKFNDSYGHDAGDQVLRKVAAKLSQVGGGGRAFRYGGEEFLIVFRGRSARQSAPFVESLRATIAEEGFVMRDSDRPLRKRPSSEAPDASRRVSISLSIGVAERSTRHSTPELVLDAADEALYRAKEAGRNCVRLDESTPN